MVVGSGERACNGHGTAAEAFDHPSPPAQTHHLVRGGGGEETARRLVERTTATEQKRDMGRIFPQTGRRTIFSHVLLLRWSTRRIVAKPQKAALVDSYSITAASKGEANSDASPLRGGVREE